VDILLDVVVGTAGFALGLWAGWKLVKRYGRNRRRFWMLNAASLLICLSFCVVGSALAATWLVVASLAVLLGAFTGLKYGWHGGLPRGDTREQAA